MIRGFYGLEFSLYDNLVLKISSPFEKKKKHKPTGDDERKLNLVCGL